MAMADSSGASSSETFMVATGPKSQVIGVNGTPKASTLVLANRFVPWGYDMAVEKSGDSPWLKAWAGQARNQRNSAESPQPQVVTVLGLVDQTCHQTPIEPRK